MLLKVDCLPYAVAKQPSILLIKLGRKWTWNGETDDDDGDDDEDDDDGDDYYHEWMNELILHCDTATEGCVSNDFFRHSLDNSPATYLT